MLPIIAGFITGLALAGLVFWITGGGLMGLILALLAAAAGYIAVSSILTPERTIGGMVAEFVPDGERALRIIDDAKNTLRQVSDISARIRDADVRREINEFGQGMAALIHYVDRNPGACDVLSSYNASYGPRVIKLLSNYADVEASASPQLVGETREKTVRAMDQVELAAQGELDNAVKAKKLQLDANASAISQLTALNGYQTQRPPKKEGAITFDDIREAASK